MKETDKMSKVFDLAVNEIEKVLSDKKAITDKTKVSVASLGVYSRLRSAEVHEEALKIMVQKHNFRITEK